MSAMKPTTRAKVLLRTYAKCGSFGRHTHRFEDLEPGNRAMLVERAALVEDECPFLVYLTVDAWAVLTLKRLVWCERDAVQSVEYAQIASVRLARYPPDKRRIDQVKIEKVDGDTVSVSFEPGGPLMGVYNVLRSVVAAGNQKGMAG